MSSVAKIPRKFSGLDRFLAFIVGGIVLLILVALLSLFLLKQPVQEPAVNSPSGVVKQFLVAMENQNYEQAYNLLASDLANKPTLDEFTNFNLDQRSYRTQERYQIIAEKINGNSATVTLIITTYYPDSSPFGSNQYSSEDTIATQRQDGNWYIRNLSYRFIPPDKYYLK